ncbi:MAG: ribbon-helix-helix protein, CopG family [Mesorhizobium sp.]|nr:MAG: ribbon-helix-helix protein, CopG family [Mesorhizobium sp.]
MSRPDLQIILRRAALMLRSVTGVSLEPATEDALNAIAAAMKVGRSDLIQIVLREWLETAYLPVRTIDEENETDGSA